MMRPGKEVIAMVTLDMLIAENDRFIAQLRSNIASLTGKLGTRVYIDEFERQIAEAERSNRILRNTR
jgi:hypothetical protein